MNLHSPFRSSCSSIWRFRVVLGHSISTCPKLSVHLISDISPVVRPPKIIPNLQSPWLFFSTTFSSSRYFSSSEALDSSNLVLESDRVCKAILSNSDSGQDLGKILDALDLQLTSELVQRVLTNLQYDEKLAFQFFTWAGKQNCYYTHERQTYNDMIDILSSTKYKARQFGVLCEVLDQIKRTNGKSVPLESFLSILRTYTEKNLTHLHKFAKKKKIKLKIQPEIPALNLLLDSLCKCSLPNEAEIFLQKVKNKIIPDSGTYNVLFFGWCRVKDPKKAMKVLEEMVQMGHVPDNFTYNAAIDTFCSVGMISEARELFEFMRTKGSTISSPTAKTYSAMIGALSRANRMDDCFDLLSDMRKTGILPDVSTYQELIQGMCLAGKFEDAYKLLDEMSTNGYPQDILTYNCFIKVLCKLKKKEEAVHLCERMIELGCEPSVHTYNMLIGMFFEMKELERASGIWEEMDRRKCQRDVDTYCFMIEGLFECGRGDEGCLLLDEVINRRIKLPYKKFDSLMAKLSEIGNLHAIQRLSQHMRLFYNQAMARRFAISQKKKSASLRRG